MQCEDVLSIGKTVRVRLKIKDVSLALENETQSSILNIFKVDIVLLSLFTKRYTSCQ